MWKIFSESREVTFSHWLIAPAPGKSAAMNHPHAYEIRVKGHLAERWSDWFEGLDVQKHSGGETALGGVLVDQAALMGVLLKIHALNITLLSVTRMPAPTRRADPPSSGKDT